MNHELSQPSLVRYRLEHSKRNSIYHMTRTAPRALSLQNYLENRRMRAVRDGASRAGKSRPALLGSRTALLGSRTALREMRTNFVAI